MRLREANQVESRMKQKPKQLLMNLDFFETSSRNESEGRIARSRERHNKLIKYIAFSSSSSSSMTNFPPRLRSLNI